MNRRRILHWIPIAAIALFALYRLTPLRHWLRPYSGPQVGTVAPNFSLKSSAGDVTSLDAQRGNVVVLDFWATWCRACINKFPMLHRIQRDHLNRKVKVLAVNIEDSPARLKQFLKLTSFGPKKSDNTTEITFLIGNQKLSSQYGVSTIPHIVLIDTQGRIVNVHSSGISEDDLRAEINDLLVGT